jgi:hypothetical protein
MTRQAYVGTYYGLQRSVISSESVHTTYSLQVQSAYIIFMSEAGLLQ